MFERNFQRDMDALNEVRQENTEMIAAIASLQQNL